MYGYRGRRDGDDRLLRQGHDVACQPQVTTLNPIKNRLIGEAEVRERFGVGPDKVVEVEALCGDSIDNVPGVPGIGVKTAAELINTLRRS
jgi:5'-3' exonuclease